MRIGVIGLGYVGLPLAILASKKYQVIGFDISSEKIAGLLSGVSYIEDVSDTELSESDILFTNDFEQISECGIVIVCVPTPVDDEKNPNLGPVKSAVTAAAKRMKSDSLLVIESTINPGVCDEVIVPIIESVEGRIVGKNIYLAHCPERINPGDQKWDVSNINRVIGASDEKGLEKAYEFYSSIISADIKKMNNLKEAEAVKIVENSFRDVNIAFVNELAMSFHKLGIDVENVIEGAATKPFSFMPHHPGIGVGGHCIPVDPYYLIDYAGSYGFQHKFLSLAREINEDMPKFTYSLLREAEEEIGVYTKAVTILGLSYKADVGDLRESPATKMIGILKSAGYEVDVYDPYFEERSTISSLSEALSKNQTVILATSHSAFRTGLSPDIVKRAGVKIFVDGRNVFHNSSYAFLEAGVIYKGIGT